MKVGLTYDLKDDYLRRGFTDEQAAEFDSMETIEGIAGALASLGHEVELVGNARMLVEGLARGARWDLVFNIAEGMHGYGREALVPALLDEYGIPYTFSDPLVMAVTLHKAVAKTLVGRAGIPTADFAVIEDPADADGVRLPFPLFAKPVAEGTGKGIGPSSRIETKAKLREVCTELLRGFGQAVLVETFLPGREFTAGIVGTGRHARVIAVMEVSFRSGRAPEAVYSFHAKKHYEDLVDYSLAGAEIAGPCSEAALAAWRVLGCRDGGRVDLRMDGSGRPNFMEVNPLAGLNPVHSDLPIMCRLAGMPYRDLIEGIVESASGRAGRAGR
jgi:D-alanine-D-alanine ligase